MRNLGWIILVAAIFVFMVNYKLSPSFRNALHPKVQNASESTEQDIILEQRRSRHGKSRKLDKRI